MSQVRLSIPFVGGLTKVYEQQEFNKEMKAIAEKAKWTSLVVVGLGLTIAEVVVRKSMDACFDTGNYLAHVHDEIIEPAQAKNGIDKLKLDHAYKFVVAAEKYDNGAGTCCVA